MGQLEDDGDAGETGDLKEFVVVRVLTYKTTNKAHLESTLKAGWVPKEGYQVFGNLSVTSRIVYDGDS